MKITLDSIISGFKSVTKLIANFDSIESELNDKVLYRDNPTGEPNQMENDIDLNSNDLLNVNSVNTQTLTLGGQVVVPSDSFTTANAAEVYTTVALLQASSLAAGVSGQTYHHREM